MANSRAIRATSESIVRLLQQAWKPGLFGDADLHFQVYSTRDFSSPMEAGVSLFLYRTMLNQVQRNTPERVFAGKGPARSALPLELHFLLTPWAQDPLLEQEILGWAMRVLSNSPVMPAAFLNTGAPQVFDPEETVEILLAQLTTEELLRIWEGLPGDFHLSAPLTARVIRI